MYWLKGSKQEINLCSWRVAVRLFCLDEVSSSMSYEWDRVIFRLSPSVIWELITDIFREISGDVCGWTVSVWWEFGRDQVITCLVITCGVDARLMLYYWSARTLLWRRNCYQWPRVVSSFHRLGLHAEFFMVALCNRADHYIFILFLLSSSFFFFIFLA